MNENRIIRLQELKKPTGLSSATILRKENTFPKRWKISKREVGWLYSEVNQWLDNKFFGEN